MSDAANRTIFQTIFTSPNRFPSRLRAGWRLLIHTLLIGSISVPVGLAIFIPVGVFSIRFDSPVSLLASELTMLIAITSATYLSRRFLDKQSFVSMGLSLNRRAFRDVAVGIGITFFQMGLVLLIFIGMGWTTIQGFSWQSESLNVMLGGLTIWFFLFVIVGWQEELLSRGYHLQSLESGLNIFWAVLLSSSIFGFLHIFNPGATWISTLGIVLAGLFLALPYLLTRQLWLSIGLHIGWNFFEGVVFGFPVSGLNTYHLLRQTVNGPTLWTGGVFGPEAGIIIIPVLLIGSLMVYFYAKSNIFSSNLK